MEEMSVWLSRHGLSQYEKLFRDNAIELDVLAHLDADDLRELQLPLGDRKRLQLAIAKFSTDAATDRSTSEQSVAVEAEVEHRQLSVMFCDLVGSVSIGEQLEIEDYRELLNWFRSITVNAVETHNGFVARHQGDGLLAYFGYPKASEYDAESAVHAGLEIIASVAGNVHAGQVNTRVRVGIATGDTVVGDVLATGDSTRAEHAVLGSTPNLAARLQSAAEPDTLLISATTEQIVHGQFEVVAVPELSLKGMAEPVNAFRVSQALNIRNRFVSRTAGLISPLVGREHEAHVLAENWRQGSHSGGKLVFINGEAGLGKSRLVEHVRSDVVTADTAQLHFQCSARFSHSPLHPVVATLQHEIGSTECGMPAHLQSIFKEDTEADRSCIQWIEKAIDSELTGGSRQDAHTLEQRQLMLRALAAYVIRRSSKQSMLVVVEDLHWADPSTLEWLEILVAQFADAHGLLLLTSRPEYQPGWIHTAHCTQLSLLQLSREASKQLFDICCERRVGIDKALGDTVVERGDGNPMFIEELTRALAQTRAGGQRRNKPVIPSTIQDSLMAQLDRLNDGKKVAQVGAVLGKGFQIPMLEQVFDGTTAQLQQGLDELQGAGLLYQDAERQYVEFKHALVQDTAYASLLRTRLQPLHQKVASVLEEHYPSLVASHPEQLAHHLTEAGLPSRAVPVWARAGRQAVRRSAYREGVVHLGRGLEVIDAISSDSISSDTTTQKLQVDMLLTLANALVITEGFSEPRIQLLYERAQDLCKALGLRDELTPVLQGLRLHHISRAQMNESYNAARSLLEHAERYKKDEVTLEACKAMGVVSLLKGDVVSADVHLSHGIEICNRLDHSEHPIHYDTDARVTFGSFLSWVYWVQGKYDLALQTSEQALTTAYASGHDFSVGEATGLRWMLLQQMNAPDKIARELRQLEGDSNESGLWDGDAEVMAGWLISMQGDAEGGAMRFSAGEKKLHDAQAWGMRPYRRLLRAQMYFAHNATERALEELEEGLVIAAETGEEYWAPPLLLQKLQCLEPSGERQLVADGYRRLLDLAITGRAWEWALQALNGLVRVEGCDSSARSTCENIFEQHAGGTRAFREAQAWFVART